MLPQAAEFGEILQRAIEEDLGRGDITTDACVPGWVQGSANIVARQALVLAGVPVVTALMQRIDPAVSVSAVRAEGEKVSAGDSCLSVRGPASSMLRGERLCLNFLQRMSSVATTTRAFVDCLSPGSPTKITDTRKTMPGLRPLERYAVRCGGGFNHRVDLGASLLIKDNHIAAAGGITIAVARARATATHTAKLTCEVDTIEQLVEALGAGVDIVLVDNFSDAQVASAVQTVDGRAKVEVSGGITLDRVSTLSSMGVDYISVGALTHSATTVDLGMDWHPHPGSASTAGVGDGS